MTDERIPTVGGDDSGETLEERLRKLEKENRGLVSDIAGKREEIRSLKEEVGQIQQSLASAGEEPGDRPENRVNLLAQDPDGFIDKRFEERVKPLEEKIKAIELKNEMDAAYRWLGKKVNKDVEDIYYSDLDKELVEIVRAHGLNRLPPMEGMQAAYKIHLQDQEDKKRREAERDERIGDHSSEQVRRTGSSGRRTYTRGEVLSMSATEYDKNREDILAAEKEGRIK